MLLLRRTKDVTQQSLHRRGKSENPLCATCQTPQDIPQIFLVCPAYNWQRQHLFSTLYHAAGRLCFRANDLLCPLGTPAAMRLVFVALCLFLLETQLNQCLWTKPGYFKTWLSSSFYSSFLLLLIFSNLFIAIFLSFSLRRLWLAPYRGQTQSLSSLRFLPLFATTPPPPPTLEM